MPSPREKRLDLCAQCDSPTWCWPTKAGPICGACRVTNFFERVLYGPIGFTLLPWIREELRIVYGTVDVETGCRRYRQVFEEVPKKNGKSFWMGGLPLYHLLVEGDEVSNPLAFGAAAAREQAGIVFHAAAQLVKNNELLRDRVKILPSTKRILRRDGHGAYIVLSADGDLQDGIEPSLGLIDELHRFKTKKALTLREMMIAGTVSREEPLIAEITSAGDVYDSPVWWQEHERARQIIEGSLKSDRFHGRIFSADEKRVKAEPDHWKSREARVQANPSHEDNGGFLKDAAIKAMLEELGDAAYKRYHLGLPGQRAERWMPMDAWLACSAPPKPLIDRKCWAGIDLSKSIDLTSLVLLFPDGEELDILPFFWMPEGHVQEIQRRVHVDLDLWISAGLITACPGPVVDYEAIRQKLLWARETFRLQEVCFDPWNATDFVQRLIDDGFTCIEVRQGPKTLSPPMKWLMDKVLLRQIRHGGHEVLNWNADCVTAKTDSNGNICPAKDRLERDGKRIDGISALITAAARVMVIEKPKKSVYSEPNVKI